MMTRHDTLEIFQKTEGLMDQTIASIQQLFGQAAGASFKMQLINSCETLKERREMLKNKLKELQKSKENEPPDSKPIPAFPSDLTDAETASLLFDLCNDAVKNIYTWLNHYKGITEKSRKEIKESVKAVERLRENIADYL